MKIVFHKYLLPVLLICYLSISAQELKLNLTDAVSIALQNNERIKQYHEKVEQKEFEDLSAWGNFLPAFNLDVSYTHLNSDMTIDLNSIRDVIINTQSSNQAEFTNIYNLLNGKASLSASQKDAVKVQAAEYLNSVIPAFTETFKEQNYKTATITGVQPLFLGGKLLAAKKYASSEKEASSAEFTKIKDEIITETIINYARVLLLKQVVKTRHDVLDGMNRHKNDAKKLFDEGIIANHHLLRAEVAVAEAERNLINDQNNFSLALITLKHTLCIEDKINLDFNDSLAYKTFSDSINTFISGAIINQPILKILTEKKIAAEQNYNIARSGFLPTLAAFAKYEMYPEYLSSLEPRWAVGLQMKFNIFNGFKDYLKLQSAIHLENEVGYMQSDTKRKINLWVNKAFLDVINNKTRYEKLTATVKLATENLRQNEKRFQTGLSTSLEVIDARMSFERVQVERFVSLFEYYRSLSDLYLAAGNPIDVLKIWSN